MPVAVKYDHKFAANKEARCQNIRPVSDLRSYSSVLEEVAQGSPVFLTKNGRGRYVILDISDYQRYEAEQTLLAQVDHGKKSAEERGTLTTEQLSARFADRFAKGA